MNRNIFSRLVLLGGAVLAVASVGWAKTYPMNSMTTVPGAAGEVTFVGKGTVKFRVGLRLSAKGHHGAQ